LKKILSAVLAAMLTVSLAACGSTTPTTPTTTGTGTTAAPTEKTIEFTLSTPDPDTSSITVAANEFAKKVLEKSNGSIKIKVYPNGSLYGADPSAAVKQLGSGALDMLVLSTSLYANFEKKFNAISIPYLFDDTKQFTDYLNSDTGKELLGSIDSMGITGLGYWTRSFRQITNAVRPITVPADLAGVKLRVPNNPLWVNFFKEAGAIPTPMAFGEVYNALQLKTIDGQENPVDVPVSAKFYEVQKYISVTNHMADGWIVGINTKKYGELSDAQKKVLEDVTMEMQGWKVDYDNEQDQTAIDTLVSKGMTLNEITAEQQQQFVDVAKKLYPTFKELVGDEAFFNKTLEFVGKK
jgi:tripartite ATP-independent transporter DctP family solute receptor